MKLWVERALAALRWVWERFVALAKAVLAKLTVLFNTVYDPPPKTIRFWFWSWAAMVAAVWLTFAFTNSWFYRPTVEFFATLADDGDVFIPDHIEPLPSVATPAVTVPSAEVICHDMSDTPHCDPVLPAKKETEGKGLSYEVEKEDIPQLVVKSKPAPKKLRKVRSKPPLTPARDDFRLTF